MEQQIIVRPLEEGDFFKGFLETFSNLTPTELSKDEFKEIFDDMLVHYNQATFVAVQADHTIVGTAMIVLQKRFAYLGGKAAHIEDVATRKGHEGKGIGKMLISHLVAYAKQQNCYRVTLECAEGNILFYEKCGFRNHGASMRIDP